MSTPDDTRKDQRSDEFERREEAQNQRGHVEEGSGRALEPLNLDQMVSVRLGPELAESLRSIAENRSTTLSAVLREAALTYVSNYESNTVVSWRVLRGTRTEPQQGKQIWPATSPASGSVQEAVG